MNFLVSLILTDSFPLISLINDCAVVNDLIIKFFDFKKKFWQANPSFLHSSFLDLNSFCSMICAYSFLSAGNTA